MLLTAAVFHSTMLPYVVASPPIHAVTAAATLPCVMHRSEQLAPHILPHVGYSVRSVAPHSM